jgi:two-component sensor histidine kinase
MRKLGLAISLTLFLLPTAMAAQSSSSVIDSIRQVAKGYQAQLSSPLPGTPVAQIDSMLTELQALPADTNTVAHLFDLALSYMVDGQLQRTAEFAKMAEQLSRELHYVAGVNDGLSVQGMAYRRMNDYPAALRVTLQALKLNEENGYWREMAICLSQIGSIYMDQDDVEHALQYYLRSERMLDTLSLTQHQLAPIHNYLRLGRAYHKLGKCDSALHFLQLHEEMGDVLQSPHPKCEACLSMAVVLKEYSHPQRSEHYFLQALELCESSGMKPAAQLARLGLAQLHQAQGKHALAIAEATPALDFFTATHVPDNVIEASRVLASAHRGLGQNDQAYAFEHRAFTLYDSLYKEKRLKEYADLKTQFEVRQRETEVTTAAAQERQRILSEAKVASTRQWFLLIGVTLVLAFVAVLAIVLWRANAKGKRDRDTIEAQRLRLETSLAEREALLREIHHRVKNNLQVISGLLSLQSGQSQSEELKGIMREGQSRVKSMALIHQMLYQHDNLSAIPFQDYLEALTRELKSTYGRQAAHVQLDIRAQDAKLDVDTAIPLGLIVNELVTNAYKYAFEGIGDRISIQLQQVGAGQFELDVRDNGKGLPKDFELGKSQSLGLRLVQLLCRQIRAELTVESAGGAHFRMTFKADNQPQMA